MPLVKIYVFVIAEIPSFPDDEALVLQTGATPGAHLVRPAPGSR